MGTSSCFWLSQHPKTTNKDEDAESNHPGDLKFNECTMPSDQNLDKVPEVINLDEYIDTDETYVTAIIKDEPLFQEDQDFRLEGN